MLRAVIDDGHEIGSHSISHHPVTLKLPDQAETEVCTSRQLIEDRLGNYKITSFCYPFYWSHQYLGAAVKSAGYRQARGGGIAPDYVPSASYYPLLTGSSIDKLNVDCRQISPQGEDVTGWLRDGCWHVLTYHAIGDDKDGWEPVTVAQFSEQMAQLASYRNSGDVEVVTFKDGAARFDASNK
ncbi:MAG TPA: polysaccharide deacetylase family protein [Candidatus Sulfotelmatobacter sp.]|nr:polysaccharide deacetylase family protein [Candidatus Sulfotelmatobacter sp.]